MPGPASGRTPAQCSRSRRDLDASERPGVNDLLSALSFPFWRRIIQQLAEPATLDELASRLGERVDLLEGHIRRLESMGLVFRAESGELRASVSIQIEIDDRGVTIVAVP
jgi:predicted transcriptional regulator